MVLKTTILKCCVDPQQANKVCTGRNSSLGIEIVVCTPLFSVITTVARDRPWKVEHTSHDSQYLEST